MQLVGISEDDEDDDEKGSAKKEFSKDWRWIFPNLLRFFFFIIIIILLD